MVCFFLLCLCLLNLQFQLMLQLGKINASNLLQNACECHVLVLQFDLRILLELLFPHLLHAKVISPSVQCTSHLWDTLRYACPSGFARILSRTQQGFLRPSALTSLTLPFLLQDHSDWSNQCKIVVLLLPDCEF
jgi:hypothetical protein